VPNEADTRNTANPSGKQDTLFYSVFVEIQNIVLILFSFFLTHYLRHCSDIHHSRQLDCSRKPRKSCVISAVNTKALKTGSRVFERVWLKIINISQVEVLMYHSSSHCRYITVTLP